ncbi:MAG: sigma-70 family RNA polymerase sigma factor [Bacteroidia bacterium]|nr:sigma-70 family RNA polymerase sigma factor [Bacteroidia bacterium]
MKAISKHHISDTEMAEEFNIIERAKTDIDEFKPLYHKYYNEIKKSVENTLFVNYAIKNEELTKDITASVFESALTKLHQYKIINGIPFKSWLYRIMQNEIASYIRKSATREKHEKFVGQLIPKYDEIHTSYSMSPTEDAKLNHLKKYLPKLRQNDQLLLQYRFFNDYSYKEISKIMGLSENNLRTRMTRLLKKIQNYIENKSA